MRKPTSGRKTIAWYIGTSAPHQVGGEEAGGRRDGVFVSHGTLASHHVDVFDRDRAAVAEEHHQDGKPDRRLRRRHGQDEQGEDLADDVVEIGRERDEVDVHREQDQFHRHQDDDDVLAVEEDPENAEREQHRADSEKMAQSDHARASLYAFAEGNLPHLDSLLLRAGILPRDVLTPDPHAIPQGQHDGADHRDQQDQAGGLEEVEVLRVQHVPDGLGVGHLAGDRGLDLGLQQVRVGHIGADDQHQLKQEDDPDQGSDRQILQESLPKSREVHVEHHDDEQEQDRHGPHIDDHQDHRQELGPEEHEQPRRVHERENQEQHGLNRVAGRDHHEGRSDGEGRKKIEEGGVDRHGLPTSVAAGGTGGLSIVSESGRDKPPGSKREEG